MFFALEFGWALLISENLTSSNPSGFGGMTTGGTGTTTGGTTGGGIGGATGGGTGGAAWVQAAKLRMIADNHR